jgi:hypothetical protein
MIYYYGDDDIDNGSRHSANKIMRVSQVITNLFKGIENKTGS